MRNRLRLEERRALPLWDVLAGADGSILWTLDEKQVAYSDRLALRRRAAAVARRRAAHNGAPTENAAALKLDVLGMRAECVGYLYLRPIVWHTFADKIDNLPDLGDFIDVKGRAKNWYDLPIQEDDLDSWAYLLVTQVRHPCYRIVGWCWGYEGKQTRFWPGPQPNRPAFFVPQRDPIIKPPAVLWDIVRGRRSGRRPCIS